MVRALHNRRRSNLPDLTSWSRTGMTGNEGADASASAADRPRQRRRSPNLRLTVREQRQQDLGVHITGHVRERDKRLRSESA